MFNQDFLALSSSYAQTMKEEILPFLQSLEKTTLLTVEEGINLYCVSYTPPESHGTVALVHGFTENAYKYAELIYSLLKSGYCVLAYDQRGHGRSWQPNDLQDHSVVHVDRFQDYVNDLQKVCERLLTSLPKPWMLFAHSMGGAVGALFLEQHPEIFTRAVLSSPMIAPNTGGVPAFGATLLCRYANAIGHKKKHPFFMKPYDGAEDFATSAATSPERFAWYDAIKAARKEFQSSIPSYNWVMESIGVTKKILAPGEPEKIRCPLRLYSAESDFSVMPLPQQQFIERVAKGTRTLVKGSRHEIFRSTDDVFFPWWHEVLGFFAEQK